jgi:AcrR family transcriptional regulator
MISAPNKRVTVPFVYSTYGAPLRLSRGSMRADAKKNYEHILKVAGNVLTKKGADASLRDIARRAEIGLGTLYRHFPTREALLEALLRTRFDELTTKAEGLGNTGSADDVLISWVREVVACTRNYEGVISVMMTSIKDEKSALHSSCISMRAAGARLLKNAQMKGLARNDMDGADLFSLIAAIAWLGDQSDSASRAEHLFEIIASAILTKTNH